MGPGTAVTGPRNKSTPAEFGTTLLPNVPEITADSALLGMEKKPTVSTSQKLQGSVGWGEPLNWPRFSVTGLPVVVNVIVVTPNRMMSLDVCAATNGSEVPKPRSVRFARVRLSLQGVGVSEDQQAANSIHWPTKMLVADAVVVIVAGATKIARSSARAEAKDLFMMVTPFRQTAPQRTVSCYELTGAGCEWALTGDNLGPVFSWAEFARERNRIKRGTAFYDPELGVILGIPKSVVEW
jgi:hypothetical protein